MRTIPPATLERLAQMLRRRPMTAKDVAKRLGCSAPTAYQRIRALKRLGQAVTETPAKRSRRQRPGPRAIAYGIRT